MKSRYQYIHNCNPITDTSGVQVNPIADTPNVQVDIKVMDSTHSLPQTYVLCT